MTEHTNFHENLSYCEVFSPRVVQNVFPESTNPIEQSFQHIANAITQINAITEAVTHSRRRYQYAIYADDIKAQVKQADAVLKYADQIFTHFREIIRQLPILKQLVITSESDRQQHLRPTKTFEAVQMAFKDRLPTSVDHLLRESGFNDADLLALRSAVLTQNLDTLVKDITDYLDQLHSQCTDEVTRYQTLAETFRTYRKQALLHSLPEPLDQSASNCPICHQPLTWITQYHRWYCYTCNTYREPGGK